MIPQKCESDVFPKSKISKRTQCVNTSILAAKRPLSVQGLLAFRPWKNKIVASCGLFTWIQSPLSSPQAIVLSL